MRALRRTIIVFLSCALPWLANAQNYPTHPIRFFIPYSAGMIDTTARAVAQRLSERLGQPVVPENRPGASQIIALDALAKSAPDGYTLGMGTQSGLVLLTASKKSLPYDPLRDFQAISVLFSTPFYLVVRPEIPVHSVAELIAYAKAHPGKLHYASIGPGSGHHLVTELLKTKTGIDILHVPYRGSSQADTGLLSGDVEMMFEGPSILALVKTGKVRALASSGAKRAKATPDLPTVGETVPGFAMATWFGLAAPAGVPRPIVDRINREVREYLSDPATQQKFAAFNIELTPSTPEEMAERVRTELPVWTKVMRSAGIQPE